MKKGDNCSLHPPRYEFHDDIVELWLVVMTSSYTVVIVVVASGCGLYISYVSNFWRFVWYYLFCRCVE